VICLDAYNSLLEVKLFIILMEKSQGSSQAKILLQRIE